MSQARFRFTPGDKTALVIGTIGLFLDAPTSDPRVARVFVALIESPSPATALDALATGGGSRTPAFGLVYEAQAGTLVVVRGDIVGLVEGSPDVRSTGANADAVAPPNRAVRLTKSDIPGFANLIDFPGPAGIVAANDLIMDPAPTTAEPWDDLSGETIRRLDPLNEPWEDPPTETVPRLDPLPEAARPTAPVRPPDSAAAIDATHITAATVPPWVRPPEESPVERPLPQSSDQRPPRESPVERPLARSGLAIPAPASATDSSPPGTAGPGQPFPVRLRPGAEPDGLQPATAGPAQPVPVRPHPVPPTSVRPGAAAFSVGPEWQPVTALEPLPDVPSPSVAVPPSRATSSSETPSLAKPNPHAPLGATIKLSDLRPLRAEGGQTVAGVLCYAGHLNPPSAALCRICRGAVPQQEPTEVIRPALGYLRLPTGETVTLDRGVILGRNPRVPPGAPGLPPHLIRINDPRRDISSLHLEIRLEDWFVTVRDLGSTNGTQVTGPGAALMTLRAHEPTTMEPGTRILLANVYEVVFLVTP